MSRSVFPSEGRRTRLPVAALGLAAILACGWITTGCGSREDPLLALSSAEALQMGHEFLEAKKYYQARRHLLHAFEVSPNSPGGREGLLLAADTFYLQGGEANLIQAESKYRDFLNRFPTSDKAAYVQYQLANSLLARIKRADRDQSITQKAYDAFQEVIRLYPTSEYAGQAREQVRVVRDRMAEHEMTVGRFYLSYLPTSALPRFETVLEEYPDYTQRDELYFYLVEAYLHARKPQEGLDTLARLRREFPDSEYTRKLAKGKLEKSLVEQLAAKAAAEAAQEAETSEGDADTTASEGGQDSTEVDGR